MWHSVENGKTIGKIGSENGHILADEEYRNDCRITLEDVSYTAPYSITCGIYGLMVHTTFADDKAEAEEKYAEMKKELQAFLDSNDDGSNGWCERFTSKW